MTLQTNDRHRTAARTQARTELEVELASSEIRVERRRDGQLWASVDGTEGRTVRVCRCFPWSAPQHYVSLRDFDDEEVALVRSPDELDPASRKALEEALAEAGFVLQVTRIVCVEEEIEIRTWKVETVQGARSFQTPRDEWPREVPGGGLLIRDVAGDLYHIPVPDQLDESSQRELWAFVD